MLPLLKGTYGLAVPSPREPGVIVTARLGSPLVLGLAEGQTFVASDGRALAGLAGSHHLPRRSANRRADRRANGRSSTNSAKR